MKRALSFTFTFALLLLLTCVGLAQESGQLVVTVQASPDPTLPAAPAAGVKVIVVHWANSGVRPTLAQDRITTTNQMGRCTVQVPPGTYDVFISGSGLAPAAFRRDVKAGENTPLTATLKPAPMQLRPAE